jgi:hypothetical protein
MPPGKDRRPGQHLDQARQIWDDSRQGHHQPKEFRMDFSLSPEQEAVQEKAPPLSRQVREMSARLDREARFPREILHLWAQAGMFGLAFQREYGVEVLWGEGAKGFFVNGLCHLPTNNRTSGDFFRKEALWPKRD